MYSGEEGIKAGRDFNEEQYTKPTLGTYSQRGGGDNYRIRSRCHEGGGWEEIT
jgi:hypothetical protein